MEYNIRGVFMRYTLVFLSFLFLLIFTIENPIYAQSKNLIISKTEDKRVLFISSYSPSFSTFFQQIDGLKQGFKSSNIQIDIEFMDTKRFVTKENIHNFYTNLKYKINNLKKYDGIITADDSALKFALEYQNDLFKGIPIVFFGVNNRKFGLDATKNPSITGILEVPSIGDTIEVAKKLIPNAKRVIAITDNTNSGQGDLISYQNEQKRFPNIAFNVLDLSKMDFNEFINKVDKIDNETIVLLLSLYTDKNNTTITFKDGLKLLLSHCNQPIFHPYYHGLNDGVIGGKVISHFELGKESAQLLLKVFNGTPISSIPCVTECPNKYIFDYNVLKAYSMNLKALPAESILLNRELSFIEEYFHIVMIVIVLFLFMLIIAKTDAQY